MNSESDKHDAEFSKRRDEARGRINAMDRDVLHDEPERQQFFNTVYENAKGDAAFVPWADLKAKAQLEQWLAANAGIISSSNLSAMDVACGLGDNAEALASAGYQTTAFDLAADAIDWAKKRFPESRVDYHQADLFNLPDEWIGAFDLVHECYTLQALPPEMVERTATAIASLVKPGGTLLVFTRIRPDGTETDGPPWPLEERATRLFDGLGFSLVDQTRFTNQKQGPNGLREIPHAFMEWCKRE